MYEVCSRHSTYGPLLTVRYWPFAAYYYVDALRMGSTAGRGPASPAAVVVQGTELPLLFYLYLSPSVS